MVFIEHLLCVESCSRHLRQVPSLSSWSSPACRELNLLCEIFFLFSKGVPKGYFVPVIVTNTPVTILHGKSMDSAVGHPWSQILALSFTLWSASPPIKGDNDSSHIQVWLGHGMRQCFWTAERGSWPGHHKHERHVLTLGRIVFGRNWGWRVSLRLGQRNHRLTQVGDFHRLRLLWGLRKRPRRCHENSCRIFGVK